MRYIYNVTVNIETSIYEQWINWIEPHIVEVLNTGRFVSAKFTEVLVDETIEGKTYSIQYTANSKEDLEDYYKYDADAMRKEAVAKFGDKMVAFRTELRVIKEFFPTSVSN